MLVRPPGFVRLVRRDEPPSPLWGLNGETVRRARRSLGRVGVKPILTRQRLMISTPPVRVADTLPIKGREQRRLFTPAAGF